MPLNPSIEDYFKNMTPLARKMHEDVLEAKSAYGNLWESFTENQKIEILNESLIKPEIAIQYATLDNFDLSSTPIKKDDYISFFGQEHGARLVHDDNTIWRDEHSAPFLYQSKSQLNLCVLSEHREKNQSPVMSDLAISHSKVLCELKNALKSHDLLKNAHKNDILKEPIMTSTAGFISKLMGNKSKHRDDDRECLVTETPTPVVASSENFFRTNFKSPTNANKVDRDYRSVMLKSNSDVSDEQRGLLSSISHGSSTEFHSCEDIEVKTESTETLTTSLPKTGFDFLDNW